MFQVGDTVQLKSGGPIMTVVRVIGNPAAGSPGCTCMWFVDYKPVEYFFVFGALVKTGA